MTEAISNAVDAELSRATPAFFHIPVMGQAVVAGLAVRAGGHYLDATVGGGGHSQLILTAADDVRLTGIDQDEWAIAAAHHNLQESWLRGDGGDRLTLWQGNFADYNPGATRFDGILADLGVSSTQFDQPERGFSFRHEAPLDMRMNQQASLTAAEILNTWDEAELARIFYVYGEERLSRRFARRLVERRSAQALPHTTTELAELIYFASPPAYRHGRIHPATRVFQALRIAVNRELEVLETFLAKAPGWLNPAGKLAVISFHSLEDRIVKHTLRANPDLKVLTKKPITPDQEEIAQNPRARSAKLRIAERLITD